MEPAKKKGNAERGQNDFRDEPKTKALAGGIGSTARATCENVRNQRRDIKRGGG